MRPQVNSPGDRWWGLTRREDALFWDRPSVVYHRVYFSIRRLWCKSVNFWSETISQLDTGVPRSWETPSPQDPTIGLCLGPYGGPKGGGCFSWARYPCKVQICQLLDWNDLSTRYRQSEALGQLGQDEPASGWRWSNCSASLLYIGQMSLGIHHRNSAAEGDACIEALALPSEFRYRSSCLPTSLSLFFFPPCTPGPLISK